MSRHHKWSRYLDFTFQNRKNIFLPKRGRDSVQKDISRFWTQNFFLKFPENSFFQNQKCYESFTTSFLFHFHFHHGQYLF
jgi:hypothetical protein